MAILDHQISQFLKQKWEASIVWDVSIPHWWN